MYEEINITLKIMGLKCKNFTKLVGFEICNGNLEKEVECYLLYEYGACTLADYCNIKDSKWTPEEVGYLF